MAISRLRRARCLKEFLLNTYTKVDGTDFKREPLGEASGTVRR